MSTDSPPESPRRAPGGEFTWPPSREELDAIEVIPLGDTTQVDPSPVAVVPAKSMAAPSIGRRGRLRLPRRLPRRDDLVFAGVLGTSVMAIAVAASMQFSDLWRPALGLDAPSVRSEPSERPLAPMIVAQALPAMSTLAAAPVATAPVATGAAATGAAATAPAAAAPAATRHVERRRVSTRRSAKPATSIVSAKYAKAAAPENYTRPRLISPESGRHGKLVLLVEVKKNGKVGDVDVLSSDLDRKNRSHRDLQRAAVSTVKRWRYEPAIRGGAPADTQIRVVVNIDLDSSRTAFTEANARRRAAAANRAADSVLAAR